jgi:hypothetical protein
MIKDVELTLFQVNDSHARQEPLLNRTCGFYPLFTYQ